MATATSERRPRRFVTGVLVGLGILFAIIAITYMYGGVTGVEFAPDSWSRRRFTYYQVPFLQVQVTPLRRRVQTGTLERHLRANKLVGNTSGEDSHWDLIWFSAGTPEQHEGDAAILARYLDAQDHDGKSYWLAWTKNEPEKAKILWNYVDRLANKKMYVLVPEVFEAAERSTSADECERLIRERLVAKYRLLADAKRKLDEDRLADELEEAARKLENDTGNS